MACKPLLMHISHYRLPHPQLDLFRGSRAVLSFPKALFLPILVERNDKLCRATARPVALGGLEDGLEDLVLVARPLQQRTQHLALRHHRRLLAEEAAFARSLVGRAPLLVTTSSAIATANLYGRNFIGHNYIGHNYIGHNYRGP